jgi:DNA-directed RNA polymerase specialized sigma24 family protein
MTEREIEDTLNLYGWGRWAMVNYDRLFGPTSILGQIALTGYREEPKHPVPPITPEDAMRVDAVVASMGKDTRTLFLMRYGRQMDYRPIARALRCHHSTVKNRLSCALDQVWQLSTTTC